MEDQQSAQQGAQQAAQEVGQLASGVTSREVRQDDIGQAEENKLQMTRDGTSGQRNRKAAEELSVSYDNDTRSSRGAHFKQLDNIAAQSLQNAVTLANLVTNNAALIANQQNGNLATNSQRIDQAASRDQGIISDASIETPSEAASESTVLPASTIAAINKSVADAVQSAMANRGG